MDEKTKHILFIIIIVFALALPFSNKAYHIDDTAFLYIANQILKDPLRPYSFIFEWGGHSNELATHLLDTPLVPYYIALVSWLFGRTEIILHASFILFQILAGVSFYFIARKFIKWPLTAALIMLATPTFLAPSQNLMPDAPMLSLFLLAAGLFIYGADQNNHKFLFFGSIAAGFAYLAKPNAIFIIPLMLFYCFIKKKPKYMVYQAIPVLFIVLFAFHNYYFEDRVLIKDYAPFLYEKKDSSINIVASYFFSNLSYIGGGTIFTLFLVYPFILKRKNIRLLIGSIIIAAIVSLMLYTFSSDFISGKYTLPQILLFFIFVSSAMFFILVVIGENYSNAKLAVYNILKIKKSGYNAGLFFVFVWFLGIYALNSGISGGAVRYNTLFLPPLILSYFLILSRYNIQFNAKSLNLFFILATTMIIGVLVAYADYDYANSYRDFAGKVQEKYKKPENNIFFTGSSGFQYYMQENGYRFLLQNDNSPKKGDIVINARLPSPRRISQELKQRMRLLEIVSYDGEIPIRIQNPEAHAGFYTYGGGFLPYSFSNAKLEHFDVYYVEK